MVGRAPRTLSSNLDCTIKPKIKILQDLGLSSTDIVHLLSVNPWALRTSVDNIILPLILMLKSVLRSNHDLKRCEWFSEMRFGEDYAT